MLRLALAVVHRYDLWSVVTYCTQELFLHSVGLIKVICIGSQQYQYASSFLLLKHHFTIILSKSVLWDPDHDIDPGVDGLKRLWLAPKFIWLIRWCVSGVAAYWWWFWCIWFKNISQGDTVAVDLRLLGKRREGSTIHKILHTQLDCLYTVFEVI